MKFQIPNMHHSEVNGRTHTHTPTDRHTDKPKAICPSNFFEKVGGITRGIDVSPVIIGEAKTKARNCAVTVQLICVLVFSCGAAIFYA